MRWRSTRSEIGYGAFLSYSGARDRALLPRVQQAIEKYPRPLLRPPTTRVFLDHSGISIGPDLEAKIISGLSRSTWLVVIASPEAAASKWVDREIEWWLAHRDLDRLLLVVSAGTLAWDETAEDWDPARSTALPPRLFGKFAEEPVWKTIGWRESENGAPVPDIDAAAISIASVVRGIPEADLRSEALRQTRRNLRIVQAGLAALTLLTVMALVLAYVATVQTGRAQDQARIASARLMAGIADSRMNSDIRSAMLLAVAAYRLDPTPRNHATLLRANLAAPHVVGYAATDADVTALDTSADGRTVVAGLADGEVVMWSPPARSVRVLATLPAEVTSVAVDATGRTVVAADGGRALRWRDGSATEIAEDSREGRIGAVAVSGSGEFGAVYRYGGDPVDSTAGAATVTDLASGRTVLSRPTRLGQMRTMLFLGDTALRLHSLVGQSQRIALDGNGVGDFTAPYVLTCANTVSGSLSANGTDYACPAARGAPLRVTRLGPDGGADAESRVIDLPSASRAGSAAVLSDSGRTAAVVSEDGGFYVAPVTTDATNAQALWLTGAPVDYRHSLLRFEGGSETRLVSASRRQLTVWDTEQIDRLANAIPVPIHKSCHACRSAVSLSPGASTVAVTGAVYEPNSWRTTDTVIVQQLRPHRDGVRIADLAALPVWEPDGKMLALLTPQQVRDRASVTAMLRPDPPFDLEVLAIPQRSTTIGAVGFSASEPRTVTTILRSGRVLVHAPVTGAVPDRYDLPDTSEDELALAKMAVAPGAEFAALLNPDTGGLSVYDLSARRLLGRIDVTAADTVAYFGDTLAVRTPAAVEIRDRTGTRVLRTLPFDNPRAPVDRLTASDDTSIIVANDLSNYVTVLFGDSGDSVEIPPLEQDWRAETTAALSADGRYLVTLTVADPTGTDGPTGDGTIIDRDISPRGLVESACRSASTDLTDAEWARLLDLPRPPEAHCP